LPVAADCSALPSAVATPATNTTTSSFFSVAPATLDFQPCHDLINAFHVHVLTWSLNHAADDIEPPFRSDSPSSWAIRALRLELRNEHHMDACINGYTMFFVQFWYQMARKWTSVTDVPWCRPSQPPAPLLSSPFRVSDKLSISSGPVLDLLRSTYSRWCEDPLLVHSQTAACFEKWLRWSIPADLLHAPDLSELHLFLRLLSTGVMEIAHSIGTNNTIKNTPPASSTNGVPAASAAAPAL
jgi:hypothetical protein